MYFRRLQEITVEQIRKLKKTYIQIRNVSIRSNFVLMHKYPDTVDLLTYAQICQPRCILCVLWDTTTVFSLMLRATKQLAPIIELFSMDFLAATIEWLPRKTPSPTIALS